MYGQFFVLFGIIFTGYFLRKIKFIDEAMNNGLNRFICYFAYPCLLIVNIGNLELNESLIKKFLLMLGITCALFAIYALWSYLYARVRKFPKRVANVAEISMASSNDGFMGFPIALIFFGETGLFLMMAHNVALNIYFFSYGLVALRRHNEKKEKSGIKGLAILIGKLILNPNIVAIFIGFALSLLKVPMNNPFGDYLDIIGKVATPMAMIFIGSTLAGSNFFEMFKNRIVAESALNKLVILPVITAVLVYFLPIDPMIKAVAILGCCFPTAATASMLAQQEGQNQEMASKILFFTTVVSLLTIPISIKLIEGIFL